MASGVERGTGPGAPAGVTRAVAVFTIAVLTVVAGLVLPSSASAARRGDDLSFTADRLVVDESVRSIRLVVRRATASSLEPTEAGFSTIDGEAVAGTDFEESSGRVALGVGETEATFSIAVIDDDLPRADRRRFTVRLHDPTTRDRIIDEVIIWILENDREPVASAPVDRHEVASAPAAPRPQPAPTPPRVATKRTRTLLRTTPAPGAPETRITTFRIENPADVMASTPFPERPSSFLAAALLGALVLSQVLLALWRRMLDVP